MSNKTSILVELDPSADREPFNSKNVAIELDKPEFFKYAIFQLEVPGHIRESDFDYLQSKVPSLEGLNSDYLELNANTIINLCKDDTTKQSISELAGVAVGLKYATDLLEIELNKFRKIGVAVKGKYLDYEVIVDGKLYEIETKGTTQQYYSAMIKDIIAKKMVGSNAYLRFGTVATIQGYKYAQISKCVVVDDPPVERDLVDPEYFRNQLAYYATFLSFILDSKYYNRYIERVNSNYSSKSSINKRKFFGRYNFEGRVYFGECFDYRLMRKNIGSVPKEKLIERSTAFKFLTEKVGETKFFIGIDEEIIIAINKNNKEFLMNYLSRRILEDKNNFYRFLDQDGILIVKSHNKGDSQLEEIFSEEEVEKRIGFYGNYLLGNAHKCGASCQSPGIEGKPCDIRTFRELCHWHR